MAIIKDKFPVAISHYFITLALNEKVRKALKFLIAILI
jgi:hypothetical protein